MGIHYGKKLLKFEDNVGIEEAEKLFEYLIDAKKVKVDLSELSHLHSALLQLLIIFRDKIEVSSLPKDERLNLILKGVLS